MPRRSLAVCSDLSEQFELGIFAFVIDLSRLVPDIYRPTFQASI